MEKKSLMYTRIIRSIKPIAISIVAIVLILISAFILFNKPQTSKTQYRAPSPTPQDEKVYPDSRGVNIKASFTIVTGNITRSFKSEKYHNQSPHVYLEKADPAIVHVKKTGITWNEFFKTLPMKLTKDCLITGDGETLCNGKSGALKFYLNDVKTLDLLDKEIRDRDKALIKFFYFVE